MLLKSKKLLVYAKGLLDQMQLVALGCPSLTVCAYIFRDSSTATLSSFAKSLGVTYACLAKIVGVMLAIGIANRKS
jgi:hypothetical protein